MRRVASGSAAGSAFGLRTWAKAVLLLFGGQFGEILGFF